MTTTTATDFPIPADVDQAEPATRAAQLSAVRIGAGKAVHAGHIAARRSNEPARYVPACGAGHGWRGETWHVATGEPIDEPVTCRNCQRGHADMVKRVHAAQTAHQVTPGAAECAASGPAATWGVIGSAAMHAAHVGDRYRAALMHTAQRRVYGLPDMACDGRGTVDPETERAREADTRDVDTRARDYLAAFWALLDDDRAHPVDRLAAPYAAPDDDAQTRAGDRPPVGALVMVDGHEGQWRIIARSALEQRRAPDRARVQQEGHTFNASVDLVAVRPIGDRPAPAALPAEIPADGLPWQAVGVGNSRTPAVGPAREWVVYATHGGGCVGELWCDKAGNWSAYRRGYGARRETYPTRGRALSAVGWLPSLFVSDVQAGACLVLPDGTAVTVEQTSTEHVALNTAPVRGLWGRSSLELVTLTARVLPVWVGLDETRPLGTYGDGPDRVDAEPGDVVRLTFPAHVRVSLAPACEECDADAGQPCDSYCQTRLDCPDVF